MIVVGGWPGRNVVGLNGAFGVRPAAFAAGGDFANPLADDVDAGDTTTEFVLVVSALPGSGTVTLNDDGGFSHTGAADGTYSTVGTLYSWAQGGPITQHATPETITTTFGSASTVNADSSITLSPFTFSATAGVKVSAQAGVTLNAFAFSASAAALVAAQSAATLSPFSFSAAAVALYGARSSVQLDAFSFSATASVTGEGVETFPTPAGRTLIVAAVPRLRIVPIQDRRLVVSAD